jgi:hypothetical protein
VLIDERRECENGPHTFISGVGRLAAMESRNGVQSRAALYARPGSEVAREAHRAGRAADADRRHGPGRFIALTVPAGADLADIRYGDLLRQFRLSGRRVGMPKTPDFPAFGSAYALTRFFMRLAIAAWPEMAGNNAQ